MNLTVADRNRHFRNLWLETKWLETNRLEVRQRSVDDFLEDMLNVKILHTMVLEGERFLEHFWQITLNEKAAHRGAEESDLARLCFLAMSRISRKIYMRLDPYVMFPIWHEFQAWINPSRLSGMGVEYKENEGLRVVPLHTDPVRGGIFETMKRIAKCCRNEDGKIPKSWDDSICGHIHFRYHKQTFGSINHLSTAYRANLSRQYTPKGYDPHPEDLPILWDERTSDEKQSEKECII